MSQSLCNFIFTDDDERGWRKYRCSRCGFVTVFIPNLGQPIYRECVINDGTFPGDKLKALIASVGILETEDCGCARMVELMNAWGVDGCRNNRGTIVVRLKSAAFSSGWGEMFVAGGLLLTKPWFQIADPFGSMVDEAIRQAAEAARKSWGQVAKELLFGPPL